MTIPEQIDDQPTEAIESDGIVYCTVHPSAPTSLRCNRCGRPMCSRCAVRTPVGYRCKECVRQQQDKFFNAQVIDYLIAAGASLVISFFAAFFLSFVGWFFIAFFVAPAAGGLIGRVVLRLTGKRRGRYTGAIVGAGVILGALPFLFVNILAIGIYLFMATGTAVAQFGIHLSLN
jgi:hypothetical protein